MQKKPWMKVVKNPYEDKCITKAIYVDNYKINMQYQQHFLRMRSVFFIPERRSIRWINFGDGW
jgi:hypothetical protein